MSFRTASASAARGLLGALGWLIPLTLVVLLYLLDKFAAVTAKLALRSHRALMAETHKATARVLFGILALLGLAALSWTLLGSALLALGFLLLLAACVVAIGAEATT